MHTQVDKRSIEGVYAALLSPRGYHGDLDVAGFEKQCQMLAQTEIAGVALNGATGEYCATSEAELRGLLNIASALLPERQMLCGIGSPNLQATLVRGQLAIAAGATALLLPMPYFFSYRQDDLFAFVVAVAQELPAPILLYNLPQFTTGLETETVLRMLERCPTVIGIKDSSGHLKILRALTAAGVPAARLVGNDAALSQARRENVCDGIVSGVACALPELILSLFSSPLESDTFQQSGQLLGEFLEQLAQLPTPWGLKVTSSMLGIDAGEFPFPLSAERRLDIAALQAWFADWYPSRPLGSKRELFAI